MKERLYTVGEIYRQKLLRKHDGTPYADKATILRIVQRMKHSKVRTPYGMGYGVTLAEIHRHNDRAGK